jgi:hypothetical protein
MYLQIGQADIVVAPTGLALAGSIVLGVLGWVCGTKAAQDR